MPDCPLCSSQDSVQKASAIVAGGTYQTTYQVPAQGQLAGHTVYGTVQQTGTAQTALAQRLSLDHSRKTWKKWAEPFVRERLKEFEQRHPKPNQGCLAKLASAVSFVVTIGGCLGLILLFGGYDITQDPVVMVVGAVIGIAAFVVGFWAVIKVSNGWGAPEEYRSWLKQRAVAAREASSEADHIMHQTFDRWDRLFYCHRCDIVFLPDEPLSAPSGEMLDMLMWR